MTTGTQRIELKGNLWMSVGDRSLGGHGRMALLALVAEQGTITKAAKAMKMSYKAAWDAIDQMNSLAGAPLVERTTGGKGGGSSLLTARGRQLLSNFRLIEEAHKRFIQDLSVQAQGLTQDFTFTRRFSMKTSARNQFLGVVAVINPGAVNDEIHIRLPGGPCLVATITSESTQNLALTVGSEVYALIKAPSVMLMSPEAPMRLSARNQLAGKVTRLQSGAINTEVVVDLGGSVTMTAIVTNESATRLGLSAGVATMAVFKASSIILGVPV